jgi:catechol 2,3-dioxygenase-like lactoylglutathione lyase family enzyme
MMRILKVIAVTVGVALFNAVARFRQRIGSLFRLRVRRLDHVTLPCRDLAVAEAFYVGVLGARVMLRIDAAFLRKMGRPESEWQRGNHLSLVFGAGARVDLFHADEGQPPHESDHPHYAFAVPAWQLLRWKAHLEAAGVHGFGPTRLGPPGQASLYFNDPFGNHLELCAQGLLTEVPIGAPDPSAL